MNNTGKPAPFQLAVISVALTAAFSSVNALAQDSRPALEEVIVTAQKREQSLQDTPIAITALTEDAITERQVDGVRKISQIAPSLVFNRSGTSANTYMRGIGTDIATVFGEPGVAMFIDGVYQGANFAQTAAYNDLARVEVLRGPQGTLYGRNTTGGNVNVFTRGPSFENSFDASLLYGDYNRIKGVIAGETVLIDDRLAVRGNFVSDTNDGYRDNPVDGGELEERDIQSAAGTLLFTPSDSVQLTLRGDWNKQDDDNPAWDYLEEVPGSGLSPILFGGQAAPGGREVRSERDSFLTTEHWGLSLDLQWDLGGVTLTSITAIRESDQDVDYDNDGTDIAFFDTAGGQSSEQFSQEINFSGLALDDRLEWLVGGFYFEQEINILWNFDLDALQPFFETVFPDLQTGVPPLPPGGLGDPASNPFYADQLATGRGSPVPFLDFKNDQELESIALYAQGTYALTDQLRFTAGVRWTEDEKNNIQSVASNVSPAGCDEIPLNETWEETTWRLGVDWNVGENTLLYASASTGFKAGGFNSGTCANAFDPEFVDAYEAGLKSTFLDNRLQLNLAAFFYDYQDLQVNLFVNGASILENATDTEIRGFEAEAVFVAGGGWEFDAQASFMDSEYLDFQTVNPMTGMLEDVTGNQVVRAPDLSFNVGVQYTLDTASAGSFTMRYEASHKDDYYTTIFNDSFAVIDAYTVQNARVIWRDGGNWEVQGFVENLADEEYIENQLAVATVGGVIGSWAPPRTWGIEVRYRSNGF